MAVLMDESRLTMLQRKTIQQAMDKGESLPPSVDVAKKSRDKLQDDRVHTLICRRNSRKMISQTGNDSWRLFQQMSRAPNTWRRRSHETIASSGAYDRERYRRTEPLREYMRIEKKDRTG